MKVEKYERLFTLMKLYGVSHLKHADLEITFGGAPESFLKKEETPPYPVTFTKAPPPQAVPPVESTIPHHVNEVANLLKLGDADLVDKLFPDYSQLAVKE